MIIREIDFCGKTLMVIRGFPAPVKQEIGHQLDRLQNGLNPVDWKPMTTVGKGVREIRVNESGQYRVIYMAKIEGIISVLHAFRKKTQKTRRQDIEFSRVALRKLLNRKA